MAAIHKRFGATTALDGVDLTVRAGEVRALVGENGAGKSTLMKVLAGAYRPDTGSMWVDGVPYRAPTPLAARRAGIAMIYQELSLAPHLTIEQNLLLGIEPVRGPFVDRQSLRRTANEALRRVGLGRHPETPVTRLSLAERQMVEIARAVAVGSRILVFDEPTSSLTGPDIERLFDLIRQLRHEGHAVVYISHFLEEVDRISDRFTVLRDGRVAGEGETAATGADPIVRMMVGREVRRLYPHSRRTPGEIALEIRDIAGVIRPATASLVLRRGEILGVFGLVGAGRTELVRAVFGLDPVRRGQVKVFAFSGAFPASERWRQGAGMLSEDREAEGLAVSLPVADNLTLPRLRGLGPFGLVLPSRKRSASRPWLDRLAVRCEDPAQPVAELSGGNQQKVALARLLYHGADLLLLDEPTRGIDVGAKAEIYERLDRLAAGDPQAGIRPKAVLMLSNHLPELLGLCDRVAVMSRGVLGPARPAADWTGHEAMRAATGAAA